MTATAEQSTTTPRRYTPEDLLSMPDGDRYEVVDGRLVETTMSVWSNYVAGQIGRILGNFCREHQLGWILPSDAMYRCFPDDPDRVRKPDVTFIQASRLSRPKVAEQSFVEIAPDLAVEVLSPNDLASDVSRKVREYLDAGVRMVWVVEPVEQNVAIHLPDGPGIILRSSDSITGGDVLPGFECDIAKFFEMPPGTQ